MNLQRFVVATALTAASIVGLSGTAGADPLDPLGYVRVIHGDLAVAGRPVAVTVDGQPAGSAPWAGPSPWRPVVPGQHRIAATGGTDTTVDVGAGCGVIVVTGQADLTATSRRLFVVTDCHPVRLDADKARISAVVINSPSFGLVDVELNGTHLGVSPGGPGLIVGAGAVRLMVRDLKTGAVFIRRDIQVEAGTVSTLALVGGAEAGVALAVVGDAAQARDVPAPRRPIHTGLAGRRPAIPRHAAGLVAVADLVAAAAIAVADLLAATLISVAGSPAAAAIGLAVLLCTALIAAARLVAGAQRPARPCRAAGIAMIAGGLLLAGCTGNDRPATVTRPADPTRIPATRPVPPAVPPRPTAPRPGQPTASLPAPAPAGTPASGATPGPAPSTAPASLRIARLGLDLPVGRLDGVDGLPRSLPTRQVAWLPGTATPGVAGTTAIVGHTGRGPFARLGAVRSGDELAVTDAGGHPHLYRVVSVSTHRKDAFPQEVWAPQRVPTLVLITCTGGVDPKTGLHTDNLVVRAVAA